jgi:hypothetical protein
MLDVDCVPAQDSARSSQMDAKHETAVDAQLARPGELDAALPERCARGGVWDGSVR